MASHYYQIQIRGGVHPDDRKQLSAERRSRTCRCRQLLHIPLQQHIGAAAEPLVQRGQLVQKGPAAGPQPGHDLGTGTRPDLGPHHGDRRLSGAPCLGPFGADHHAEAGRQEEWTTNARPVPTPSSCPRTRSRDRVAQAGIVGMGGATFPSSVKLNLRKRYRLTPW